METKNRFTGLVRTLSLLMVIVALTSYPTQASETPYIDQLSEKIAQNPKDASVRADRGFAYAMLGFEKQARGDFEQALKLDPADLRIRWSYGWALFNCSDYEMALEQWNHVVAGSQEKPWWAAHTLAICHWQLGNRLQAVKLYNEAVAIMPAFSTKSGLLDYTNFWTRKEQAVIEQVYDAWNRSYKLKN